VGVADRREARWVRALGAGTSAGAVAALAMTLVVVILRYTLGGATPAELVGDRLAPTLTIAQFFALLDRFGGYNELKLAGLTRVLGGQLVVGLLGGVVYALVVERQRAYPPAQALSSGAIRSGRLLMALFVSSLWLVTLLLLWPVLGTHYHGLPPG
jgi:hypothetical protein